MSDELLELDQLIESDVLEALGQESNTNSTDEDSETPTIEEDGIIIEDFIEEPIEEVNEEPIENIEEEATDTQDSQKEEKSSSSLDMNTESLASLLSQLLNNKTIEITIKVKD